MIFIYSDVKIAATCWFTIDGDCGEERLQGHLLSLYRAVGIGGYLYEDTCGRFGGLQCR